MSISTSSSQATKPKMNSLLRGLLGLLLLFPACALCSSNLFLLSFNTLQGSFQKFSLREGAGEFIGLVNYQNLFENPAFTESMVFTALQILVRLLAVAILPFLLAQAMNTIGKKPGGGTGTGRQPVKGRTRRAVAEQRSAIGDSTAGDGLDFGRIAGTRGDIGETECRWVSDNVLEETIAINEAHRLTVQSVA